MKFAKYWSEVSVAVDKTQFGTTRLSAWGASNESEAQASIKASERAAALTQLISRGADALREYEYWNGYIREEVIEEVLDRDGRVLGVLTRNCYGAIVLNTESVLFGDVDIAEPGLIAKLLQLFGKPKKDKAYFVSRIEQYQKQNPAYTLKVYETFAGLRVVVTNQIFENYSESAQAIFSALDVDPLYVKLCKAQSCFRARLTPKPWRIGIERPTSRFPRQEQADVNDFSSWVNNYESASANVSTVKLLATFGTDFEHPDVARILAVHDQYADRVSSGAASSLA
ncbi:MAG TPA: hypothetical protein VLC79_11180 [Cellvibrio sp.]|nr:hypothetical protein [Cellvibrio sp.]